MRVSSHEDHIADCPAMQNSRQHAERGCGRLARSGRTLKQRDARRQPVQDRIDLAGMRWEAVLPELIQRRSDNTEIDAINRRSLWDLRRNWIEPRDSWFIYRCPQSPLDFAGHEVRR